MQEAFIVHGLRTAVGKANRGGFRFTRADDLAVKVIQQLIADLQLDPKLVDDVIVGNAVPEAEQGLQIGRMIALRAVGMDCAGFTINRYCASGLEAIAIATAKIKSGMADCIIAGGAESMSLVPTVGWKTVPNYEVAKEHAEYYLGMGLTAEAVAKDFKISREDQDMFAYQSHQKAVKAIAEGKFKDEILPIEVEEVYLDENKKRKTKKSVVAVDEGPRADTSMEALAKLKPVFAANGTVTAGNSSQTSDGAAFTVVMSERLMKQLNKNPIGRLLGCVSAGVNPRVMGIGPIAAIPKVLSQVGLKQDDINLFEINEAFSSQSLSIVRELRINTDLLNVNGGAISLGHPLGCSGAKLSIQILNELKRRKQRYGIVSACVGGGQGIAGVLERLN
jgi:acetyl-CoA acyltransferase